MTLGGWSVRALAAAVAAGRLSPTEVARDVAAAIAADRGPRGVHAFLSHDPGTLAGAALEVERAVAAARAGGRRGPPLAGVPVAIKDNLATTDLPTTCGSRMLEGYRSPYEATVVRRLRAAGALVAGKTNLDEFAMGSSTEASAFGPTRNPHDRDRVPGGSSGGSAAAVAAGLVPVALGTDTGGSVRQPAAFCGVVGLKPTYGRVSRYGLVAFASSLDHVGTFGRTVEDAAALLQAIAGPDPRDATCADRPVPDLLAALAGDDPGAGLRGVVIGVPGEFFPPELHDGVRRSAERVLDELRAAGAEVRALRLPATRNALAAYSVITMAEASSNLARFDGVRFGRRAGAGGRGGAEGEGSGDGRVGGDLVAAARQAGFGPEVKRRIVLGTYVLSAGYRARYYDRARAARRRIRAELDAAFDAGIDVLFTPTTPSPAFRLGERTMDPYRMYEADAFTVTANLAGVPAISVPIGRADGLPVGGQLLAPRWEEARLVRVAAGLQAVAEAASPGGGTLGGTAEGSAGERG